LYWQSQIVGSIVDSMMHQFITLLKCYAAKLIRRQPHERS